MALGAAARLRPQLCQRVRSRFRRPAGDQSAWSRTGARSTSLFETAAIIDYLEETAPSGRRLIPGFGAPRHEVLQALALAHGIAEKTVALVYETSRRPADLQWSDWRERIETQIRNGLTALESRIGTATAPDEAIGISATCAYDMAACKFPALTGMALPNLVGLSERANALPAFAATHPSRA